MRITYLKDTERTSISNIYFNNRKYKRIHVIISKRHQNPFWTIYDELSDDYLEIRDITILEKLFQKHKVDYLREQKLKRILK